MKPGQFQLIKDQEVQCKPGLNPMMWELCFHNLRLCMQEIERCHGLLELIVSMPVPGNILDAQGTLLGIQEKIVNLLTGKTI